MNSVRTLGQALGWTENDLASNAGSSASTIKAFGKVRPCRHARKRRILLLLSVPWELRNEYFLRAHAVRSSYAAEEARSA